jgi:hypothetical protein
MDFQPFSQRSREGYSLAWIVCSLPIHCAWDRWTSCSLQGLHVFGDGAVSWIYSRYERRVLRPEYWG